MPDEPPAAGTPALADAIRSRDPAALAGVAGAPIRLRKDNLIPRPWGGDRLAGYKGVAAGPGRFGEAFEICAFAGDPEAAANPSVVALPDGSEIPLPELLAAAGREVLGEGLFAAHGPNLPLLPKTLDIAELLSVQAHPPGNTEVYVVLDADPGATIRLGFRHDVDPETLGTRLAEGRALQGHLLASLVGEAGPEDLQGLLAGHFARRDEPVEAVLAGLEPLMDPAAAAGLAKAIRGLKTVYWEVLDLLNEVPVAPGQVIYNANPERDGDPPGRPRSAEVHALGNPERREILLLEVRRPGPTFRSWDHVRFPVREVDIDAALSALDLRATRPEDFAALPVPVAGRPGVQRSVSDAAYVVDHLRPEPGEAVLQPALAGAHTLHAVRGRVTLASADGRDLGTLERGESVLVPAATGAYRVAAAEAGSEVVMVTVPDADAGSG